MRRKLVARSSRNSGYLVGHFYIDGVKVFKVAHELPPAGEGSLAILG